MLCKNHPYQVGRLITQTGEDNAIEVFRRWQDFAPTLMEGARNHTETVLPELANLAGDSNSGMVAAKDGYPPVFINPYTIDRERVSALFGDHVDELLQFFADYRRDNAWAVRPKAEAQKWLNERRVDGAPANNGSWHARSHKGRPVARPGLLESPGHLVPPLVALAEVRDTATLVRRLFDYRHVIERRELTHDTTTQTPHIGAAGHVAAVLVVAAADSTVFGAWPLRPRDRDHLVNPIQTLSEVCSECQAD